jgi:FixJ family two-component response regulator
VIITTGYTSPEARREAYKAGATIFLPKPFTAAEFMEAVNRALR